MGEYWQLLNQSAQLVASGNVQGKYSEFFGEPGATKEIIGHLQKWKNPFPDMNAVLQLIEAGRAKRVDGNIIAQESGLDAPSDTTCQLLGLPVDVLRLIFAEIRDYEDLLSLSATCMAMLSLLAPKTAEVRTNFEEDLGPSRGPSRSWSGQRIAIRGEDCKWPEYLAFVKKNIKAAYEKRGITDLDPEILQAIKEIDNITPHMHFYDYNGPDGHYRLLASGRDYHSIPAENVSRGPELAAKLKESQFDFIRARFIQPDSFVRFEEFRSSNPKPKPEDYPGDLWRNYYTDRDVWEEKGGKLLRDWDNFRSDRYLSSSKGRAMDISIVSDSFIRRLRMLSVVPVYDYCIVNLDTRECMRSSTVHAHRHYNFVDEAPFTPGFVLMTHIMYSDDGGDGTDGDYIYGGRWAGNRLHLVSLPSTGEDDIPEDDRALLAAATDISLEMLDQTHKFISAQSVDWQLEILPKFKEGAELEVGGDDHQQRS